MAATVKIERLINHVKDVLNLKYANSCDELYDSSHDAYLKVTVGGLQVALVKYGTVAQLASAKVNAVTGQPDVVYVPDVARVGFDQGTKASGTATSQGAMVASVTATGYATLTAVVATNTVVINGVTFTAVASGATGNQFNVGINDQATTLNLIAAVNASVTAGVADIYAAAGAQTNRCYLNARTPGAAGNAYTLVGSANIVVSGATLTGGVTGDYLTINGANIYAVTALTPAAAHVEFIKAGTAAGNAAAAAPAITAAITYTKLNAATVDALVWHVVIAVQDSGTPAQVDITASEPGVAGNTITLAETGTGWVVSGATLTGGVAGLTSDAVAVYVSAICVLLGTEVRFYSKSGIAVADLIDESLFIQSFSSVQWGLINQQ